MVIRFRRRRILLALVLLIVLVWIIKRPSSHRDWAVDQAVLPRTEIRGNLVRISNIRNFAYRSVDDYTPGYYDRTFNLEKIACVAYIVEHFSDWKGAAHTLLSFEFEDPIAPGGSSFVSVSVEIRKEKGETFSALKGLFKHYELMYVIADERDVLKLRTNYRNNPVYLFPVKGTREQARALFLDMLRRANKLRWCPEFYNTAFNTCTTNIVAHANRVSAAQIPFSFRVLAPGYSGRLAYELGLLDRSVPFEELKKRCLITVRAQECADDELFSLAIRGR